MSGLSINIFDDNGNLSYQKQFRVSRILHRGVFRDKKGFITMNAEDVGYKIVNGEWVNNSTGKFVIVMINRDADAKCNETSVYSLLDVQRTYSSDGYGWVSVDSNDVKKSLASRYIGGQSDKWWSGYGMTIYNDESYEDVDKRMADCDCVGFNYNEGENLFDIIPFDRIDINETGLPSFGISNENPMFGYISTEKVFVRKTLRGKRWLLCMPFDIDEDYGFIIKVEQNKNPKGLEYYVLEVEE